MWTEVSGCLCQLIDMAQSLVKSDDYDHVCFSCGYTSICCLMSIAVNRLIGIVYPLQYKVRSNNIKQYCLQPWQRYFSTVSTVFIIVVCWIFAPIMLLPFLVLKNEDHTDMLGWQSSQLICTFTVNSTNVYMRVSVLTIM